MASMASAVAQDANVAQGATVTVLGANDNAGTPADMVDGNNATFWQGNSETAAGLEIKLDLGSAKTFNGFSISFQGNRYVSQFTLEYSNNGSDWTTIGTYETGIDDDHQTKTVSATFGSSVSAQYVRYTSALANKNADDQWSETISEFQLLQFGVTVLPSHTDIFYNVFTADHATASWNAEYNGGATDGGFETYNGISMIKVWKALKWVSVGPSDWNTDAYDMTGYAKLSIDIYSETATSDYKIGFDVNNAGAASIDKAIELAAGWNTVSIDLSSDVATRGKIQVYHKDKAEATTAVDLKIANVYFSKASALTVNVVGSAATAIGEISSETVGDINAADVLWIDLTAATVNGEVTITPLNPNAIVRVAGTVTENVATADAKYDNLTVNNKVVESGGYLFPVGQLQLTDTRGAKFWNGEGGVQTFISTHEIVYRITRSIPANSKVTAVYPVDVTTIPDGLVAYELQSGSYDEENNDITFHKVEKMNANVPYIIENTTAAAIELTTDVKTGDFNWSTMPSVNASTSGTITLTGNYDPAGINASESTYLLGAGGNFKKGKSGVTIGAFRAYITVSSPSPAPSFSAIYNGEDGTTGINAARQQNVEDGIYYDLSGRRVVNPTKGLYIHAGKKVVIK